MNLFFIAQFLPHPPTEGAGINVFNRLDRPRTRHEVVLFAPLRRSSDPESVEFLRNRGWKVETVSKPPDSSPVSKITCRLKALFSPIPVHWVLSWDDVTGAAVERQIRACDPDVVIVEHLLMRDDARSFADATLALLSDKAKRDRAGAAGRALAKENYSWEAACAEFETHLAEMMNSVNRPQEADLGHG